eukprot:scaffold2526_cov131-Cylindrotheca_fusiformis.AAC.17
MSESFASRSSQRPKCIVPSRASSSPFQQESREIVNLLEGKLRVLEDVVEEMYRRQDESWELDVEKDTRLNYLQNQLKLAREESGKKEEKLRNSKAASSSSDRQYALKVESLEADYCSAREELKRCTVEMEGLRNGIQQKNLDIESLRSTLRRKEEEIDLLRRRESAIEEKWRDRVKECKEAKRVELNKIETSIHSKIDSFEEMISGLNDEISRRSDLEADYEERIEIAIAAVSAAEKREKIATLKSDGALKKLKQAQAQLMLQTLKVRSLEDEKQDLEADIETMQQTVEHAKPQLSLMKKRRFPRLSVRRLWSRLLG